MYSPTYSYIEFQKMVEKTSALNIKVSEPLKTQLNNKLI